MIKLLKFAMVAVWAVMLFNLLNPFEQPFGAIVEAALALTLLGHSLMLIVSRLKFSKPLSQKDKLQLMAFGAIAWWQIRNEQKSSAVTAK
ncbi:DUF1145 domain-containing protein [Paraferrimonas sedimenticola]|uniref:DUF1145 domain-containing protein n=1 Tax=Paraferrimonas sedimenticola TaxID=375674 RepID=A0AA37S041_9GAMM|nr:DUF1145 domain-containing protein [Paraferrimonas sedimenticola]GLP97817.1 hypothetical protein GCM10007895_31240 [Paraferrimonas sedimenticola]